MRSLLLGSLALAVLVAGCASGPSHPVTSTPPSVYAAPLAGGWAMDCGLGSFEQALNASWGQVCEARASHNPGPKEETWVAVNPTNPKNVIVGAKDLDPSSSGHCVWNGVFVTHDGGQSWHDVAIGGKFSERQPGDPTYGYWCNTDPDFQFTSDGAVHYGIEMYDFQGLNKMGTAPTSVGWKVLLATSTDGGDTWPTIVTYQPDLLTTTDYSRMTINPKSQAIVESIGSGDCHVMVSTDGGKSALFYNAVSPSGSPCSSNNGAIAGSPAGTLVIVGNGIAARSVDDGKTWLDSNKIFTYKSIQKFKESKYRNGSNLELAYDLTKGPNAGTLYAVYGAADRDEADIYVRSSKDDGKTWSDAALVNNDAAGTHQWMPNIVVAGDGSVHVLFMDKHFDAAHDHGFIDYTHAVSLDGGKTWNSERVSTLSYDGDLGVHQDGGPFIGDYLGIAAAGNDVWGGFPDASNGKTTVIAAAHFHHG